MNTINSSDLVLYTSQDASVSIKVRSDAENVWLTRAQLAELFGRDVKTIGKHVRMLCEKNSRAKQLSQNLRQFSVRVTER